MERRQSYVTLEAAVTRSSAVIDYFAKSRKVTRGHSKWHPWVGHVQVPVIIQL